MAKWSSQHNGKFPDPYSKLKLDEEKLKKKKKKKKDKNRDRDSILSQIDPNTNKVREGNKQASRYLTREKKLGGRRCRFYEKMKCGHEGVKSTKNRSGRKLAHFSR